VQRLDQSAFRQKILLMSMVGQVTELQTFDELLPWLLLHAERQMLLIWKKLSM